MSYIRKDIDIHPKHGCSDIITCKVTAEMKNDLLQLVGTGSVSSFIRRTLHTELTMLRDNKNKLRSRKAKRKKIE